MRAAAAQIEIKTHGDGTRYEGQMQSGKFNGQGVMTYRNRNPNDPPLDREELMTYQNGRQESGEWETGKFLG